MKQLFTILLISWTTITYADIPRVDILEVSFRGDTYYHFICMEGAEFRDGCVFNYKKEYLCEQKDYYKVKRNDFELHLYSEIIIIPKANIESKYNEVDHDYYSKNYHHLTGKSITLSKEQLDSVQFVRFILGNTGGYIFTPNLSKSDESWINDYKLEHIVSFTDEEICGLALYSIKGNISKKEAIDIKSEIVSIYKDRNSTPNYCGKQPEEYLNELLKRNILMIGFCSC